MKEKYIEDLKEIKDIMNRTGRFISLSGLSGVSTGITALVGAYIAHQTVFINQEYLVYHAVELSNESLYYLLLISIGTLLVSVANAIFFTIRKTNQQKQTLWNTPTKLLLINLLLPLVAGGILCLMLLLRGFVGMLPPLTLIFYGLALINASKYTFSEIRTLGIIEVLLGLVAFQLISYGILFWAFGFGIVQVVYGLIIQKKY